MDIGKFADTFVKLAVAEGPPPGYAKMPSADPAVYQMAKQLLTLYWASPQGTLIPFTINNIQYVARLVMHGTKTAIEVFVREGSGESLSEEEEVMAEFSQVLPQLYWT